MGEICYFGEQTGVKPCQYQLKLPQEKWESQLRLLLIFIFVGVWKYIDSYKQADQIEDFRPYY